jgi:hypothetical protein
MQPMIVFSTSRSEHDPTMQSWARFRNHIRTVHPVVDSSMEQNVGGPTVNTRGVASFWRLLAMNHRELARSYFLYSSFTAARNHVNRILENIDDLSLVTLRGSEQRTHGWYATLGGSPVLTCSRWYSGNAAASQAAIGAIRSLPSAQIVDSIQLLGARRENGSLDTVSTK